MYVLPETKQKLRGSQIIVNFTLYAGIDINRRASSGVAIVLNTFSERLGSYSYINDQKYRWGLKLWDIILIILEYMLKLRDIISLLLEYMY